MIHRCFVHIRWKVSCHFVSRKELYISLAFGCSSWTRLANVNMWVNFLSRNSEVFKIYTNYLSCLVYNQVYNCLSLASLFDFIPTMKLRHANYNEIPARSTSHVSRERTVLDMIALRKHCWVVKKNSSFRYARRLPISGLWSPSVSNCDMHITCSFLLSVLVQHISPVLI